MGLYSLLIATYLENNAYTEFSNNVATENTYDSGGAIIAKYTHLSFEGSSMTKFSYNTGYHDGGAILASYDSIVSFKDNSTTEFSNNKAIDGGAIFALYDSYVSFEDSSTTKFSNNRAGVGGAISIDFDSHVSFEDNSTTKFSNNSANYGGAISARGDSHVSFEDNSTTKFSNNGAYRGGAISTIKSNVSFEDNSVTEFSNNNALNDIYATLVRISGVAHIVFDGNSTVSFINDISTDRRIVYPISIYIRSRHYRYPDAKSELGIIARGNFTITFNYQSAKWCTNTCLSSWRRTSAVWQEG